MRLNELKNKFEQLNTDRIIEDSFDDTAVEFADMQREQLKAGKTKTGSEISPEYRSETYADEKHSMNPLPGYAVPDLYYSGNFARAISAKATNDTLIIESSDEKNKMLQEKYGENIFGLGGRFKNEYQSILKPILIEKISNLVGLKII